jgi:EmrB/QacA subfamily drug resistance transporter
MNVLHDVHILSSSSEISKEKPPVRRVLVFSIVAMALLMTTVDSTIVATALHTLQIELHTTINWVGWTITAYAFGFVLMLPISGKLSERYGHRQIFLLSIITFTLVSLCCGLSSNIYILIALRVIQAVGGAGITPSATGIIVDHFGEARDRAVSFFGSVFPIGGMIGPIFGGLFVTYWTWRGIFFVNVPIGIVVIAMALRYVPHGHRPKVQTHLRTDILGIVLLGTGVLAGMFAASYMGGQNADIFSPMFIVLLILAIVSITAFFLHIAHFRKPLIAPVLIYGKGFGAVNLINILFVGVTAGIITLVPLYATTRYGINALNSGILLVAYGVAAIALSVVAAMMLRRTGYKLPLYVGSSIIIVGTILLAVPQRWGISPFAWLTISTFLIGVGSGAINPSCRNAGLQLAPQRSSTIAALRSLFLQVGTIVTIAIATAIISESANSGHAQAWINLSAAVIFVFSIPLISRVPEHHGSW